MSDVLGVIDYARIKPSFDADDYVTIPFSATQDYYVVGTMAYLNDPTTVLAWIGPPIPSEHGWRLFAHGQPAMPAFIAALIAAGIIPAFTWPAEVPAFEAKNLLFYSDQNCWVRFEGASRVQNFIPKETYMRFHRRCLMFFIVSDGVDGICRVWIEG